jgi:beta-galactosidase
MKFVMLRLETGFALAALFFVAAHASDVPPVMLGSAWYPEGSTRGQTEADLAMMQACGLRMVRVGEYAWDSLEPEEGRYTLDWLDQAVAAAAQHGIFIVIGTPTDGPPNWLTRKYPEILRIDVDGRRSQPGSYRAFSYASPIYRELCRKIAEQLARRFGHNPNVIGWQIGNEPTEDSYDTAALQDYRDWLRAKYGTLASLNERLKTWYWSHTFNSWDEISFPGATGGSIPGLSLDYRRFVTSEWASFHRNQAETIRKYADGRQFITTNFGGLGWADRLNRHKVAKELDLAAWDDYVGCEHQDPSGHGSTYVSLEHFDPWRNGAANDLVRGWKERNFWVMEMQPAFVDWAPVSNAVGPGITRTMVWEAIGHGADGISFWQWRAGRSAVGQYHGTLVGPDTTPVPVYAEVKRAAAEIVMASAVLADTVPSSDVAILHDYDSRWAIDLHRQTQKYNQVDVLLGYYRALRERAQSVDIVDPASDLVHYKLIAAPSLTVISAQLAERLKDYVKNGGCLVLGPRSGMMDELNALNVERQPGPLVPALGGRVEQYYALVDDVPVAGKWGTGSARIWAEQLSTKEPDAEVILRYGPSNGWLEGKPAAIQRRLGRGTICYIGAVLDTRLMGIAARTLADSADVAPAPLPTPDHVEVCRRVAAGREVFVVINHGDAIATIHLPERMTDVLKGGGVRDLELSPLDVAVLARPVPKR